MKSGACSLLVTVSVTTHKTLSRERLSVVIGGILALLDGLDILSDAMQLVGDAYALRAVRGALTTTDAVSCLSTSLNKTRVEIL